MDLQRRAKKYLATGRRRRARALLYENDLTEVLGIWLTIST